MRGRVLLRMALGRRLQAANVPANGGAAVQQPQLRRECLPAVGERSCRGGRVLESLWEGQARAICAPACASAHARTLVQQCLFECANGAKCFAQILGAVAHLHDPEERRRKGTHLLAGATVPRYCAIILRRIRMLCILQRLSSTLTFWSILYLSSSKYATSGTSSHSLRKPWPCLVVSAPTSCPCLWSPPTLPGTVINLPVLPLWSQSSRVWS